MKNNQHQEIVGYIETHRRLLYKVVQGYCSNKAEQEDVIQDIIFELIRSYDKFDHRVKVTTWMYKVAFNVAISHYRKLRTRQKHMMAMPEKLILIDESKSNEVHADLLLLRQFIQELEPINRAIMIMYLDENTHAEISEAMGMSVSNVGTKINRIKKQLKHKFKKH